MRTAAADTERVILTIFESYKIFLTSQKNDNESLLMNSTYKYDPLTNKSMNVETAFIKASVPLHNAVML